jgi:UDP-N-acetylglucosamine 2-epimerase
MIDRFFKIWIQKGHQGATSKAARDEVVTVDLLHRAVPVTHTEEGSRALSNDRPIFPESVKRYLQSKFSDALDEVYKAMKRLVKSIFGIANMFLI